MCKSSKIVVRIKWVGEGVKTIPRYSTSLWMLSWDVSFLYFVSFIYKNLILGNKHLILRNVWNIQFCLLNLVFCILTSHPNISHYSGQENYSITWLNMPLNSSSLFIFPLGMWPVELGREHADRLFKVSTISLHPFSSLYFAKYSWGRELCCSMQKLEPTLYKHN